MAKVSDVQREHCSLTQKQSSERILQQALICRTPLNFPLGSGVLDYTDFYSLEK